MNTHTCTHTYPHTHTHTHQAAAFLEPASSNFKAPLNYTLPALAYGGQLDMEKPACLEMGHSYFHYYSLLTCPKILMNVTVSQSLKLNCAIGSTIIYTATLSNPF